MEDMFRIGVVSSAHGIKGAVKVFPTTQEPGRLSRLEQVIYKAPGKEDSVGERWTIQSASPFQNMVLIQVKELTDRNQAEAVKGGTLWIPREEALPLEENEYYIADVVGSLVMTEEGETLGIIDDVLMTGSTEVFAVKTSDGQEILIPSIKDCVIAMDLTKKIVTVHLLEGLR